MEYGYTNGLMTSLTAKMPSSADDQTTVYTYGVSSGSTPASTLASNHLLAQVRYPDSAGGGDVVRYAYNRLGQQTGVIDQAGNQIDTTYDAAGRETARTVSNLASGFDGSVRRVELTYVARGMVGTVTQFDNGNNATDQVRYEYDGWGNLERFRQDVDSTMSTGGASSANRGAFEILYSLAKSSPSGGVQTVRRTGVTYKAEGTAFETVGYAYGASGGLNDLFSRVASVTVGSSPATVASYDYLGAGRLVGTTLDQAQLRTRVFAESGGSHTYGDLDNFNRPTRWDWWRIGGAAFYDVSVAWDENSNPTSTVDNVHVRASTSKNLFDVVYALDALNRVIGAEEGHKSGSGIQSGYRTRNELWNSLTLTGNWKNRRLDANGDGDFTDEEDRDEPSADQVFNKANEWTNRRIAKSGSDEDEYTYTYDAVGNMTYEVRSETRGQQTSTSERGFVYDAFGRLVAVTGLPDENGPTVVERFRYNGLGFRVMWQYDADADGTLENAERYYFAHDERWRVLGTFRDQDSNPKEAFVHHAAGKGGFGRSSYIDSVILRDRDVSGGGGFTGQSDGTLEERRYYCQNWRADVAAVAKSDGTPLEYVRYSSYGEPTVHPVADLDVDGDVDTADANEWDYLSGGSPVNAAYATADVDFDGDATNGDGDLFGESYTANAGLSGRGRLSSPGVGSRLGYAGYQWDPVSRVYHVRYRVYFPEIGRWGRRDVLGLLDGANLYEYVSATPIASVDPTGCQRESTLDVLSIDYTDIVAPPAAPPTPAPAPVRPSPVRPGPLWEDPLPSPSRPTPRYSPRSPGGASPAQLCVITACVFYCLGERLSPIIFPPIDPAPVPRPPATKTPTQQDPCEQAKEAKRIACGERTPGWIPPWHKDGLPRYIPENPAHYCQALKERIQNAYDCLKARKDVTDKCFGGVPEPGHTRHEQMIRRQHLKPMEKLFESRCKHLELN